MIASLEVASVPASFGNKGKNNNLSTTLDGAVTKVLNLKRLIVDSYVGIMIVATAWDRIKTVSSTDISTRMFKLRTKEHII